MMKHLRLGALLLASIVVAAPSARADDEPYCYDAIVKARIVRQTPSVFPDCGGDCIVMVWPWFIDLDVKGAENGDVPRGRLRTLAMMHTFYLRDLGVRRWWLRRNALSGYNLLRFGAEDKPERCPAGTAPARAYLRLGPGQTLDDLWREGDRAYRTPR